jgi:cytochrome P450
MDYGDHLIEEARKRRETEGRMIDENGNKVEKKDLKVNYIIDQLVNHEEKFTNQEIREHLMTLLITGSETTSNLVATTIIYLAINQNIQQKLYDEIHEVFNDDSVAIDYDNIGSLKYLDMVVRESLRLFSPIPISIRETIDELDVGLDKPLSKGTNIFFFNFILHKRSDLWGKDANKFNPDNFSPENVSLRDPYCFLPFGAVSLTDSFADLNFKFSSSGTSNVHRQPLRLFISKGRTNKIPQRLQVFNSSEREGH